MCSNSWEMSSFICFLANLRVFREYKMGQIRFDHSESDVGAIRYELGKTDIGIMFYRVLSSRWQGCVES